MNTILKMQWWYEGQAKALETVFMSDPNYNTHTTNIVFATKAPTSNNLIHKYSYESYTRDFIKEALDNN